MSDRKDVEGLFIPKEGRFLKNKQWLNNGGAAIVLDVLRRFGWSITEIDGEEWPHIDEAIAIGCQEAIVVEVKKTQQPWIMAIAVVAVACPSYRMSCTYNKICPAPIFYGFEALGGDAVKEINEFIDTIRFASEAAVSFLCKPASSGKGEPQHGTE